MLTNRRRESSSRTGTAFDPRTLQAVWEKGFIVAGVDGRSFEKTPNGKGWEIDHILAVSQGGSDDIWNLQLL
jgi:hypothetical protein